MSALTVVSFEHEQGSCGHSRAQEVVDADGLPVAAWCVDCGALTVLRGGQRLAPWHGTPARHVWTGPVPRQVSER